MAKNVNSKNVNSRKKKKKVPLGFRIVAGILLLVSLLFLVSILYLNVLSLMYLMIVILVVLLIDGICTLMMFKGKRKIGLGLSSIFILIFGLLSFYIIKTTDFLSDMNLDYKTYNYSVIVLKDSSYETLKDINGKVLGYYDNGSEEGEKALNKVMGKVELESNSYDDTHKASNALLEKEVDAVLIEDAYLEVLNEEIVDGDKVFKDMIRKIYSFKVVVKTSDISKDINVTKEPFNIYVSGIDTYGEISSVSRSDVNMVVSVNPATQQILLTSIPRDYYVPLHGKSGYNDKLTHAGMYGTDMSISTIEDLLDIEINYYVKVNFSSVINIVDAIGGVKVYSDYTFTSIDNYTYQEGYNEVNGEEALSFARERKSFATGDRQRVKNQQALIKAIFEKCTSKSIITKYTKLLDSLNGSFVTNMKMSRLTSLVRLQLAKNYKWNLVSNSLEGEDARRYTYSAPSQMAYVMEIDEVSVAYATELINKVIAGEKLDEEVMEEASDYVHSVVKNKSNSSNSTSSNNKNTYSASSNNKKEGLKVNLGRSEVTFAEGDEYIYYGYTATYDGMDITESTSLTEKFTINGNMFTDYRDLISYISNNLSSGTYTVIYTIGYKGDSVVLNQKVTIEESAIEDSTDNDISIDNEIDSDEEIDDNSGINNNDVNSNISSNEEDSN